MAKASSPIVLITGATGILGGATLAHLLAVYPDARVLALVRGAANEDEARERLRRRLAKFEVGALADRETLVPICADITDRASLDDPRLDDATHVVHAAANTSFRSIRSVRQTNIVGTMALAHRLRRARKLKRFLYVGTAYCVGMGVGPVVREDDAPKWSAQHFVEYTRSKAEAEMLLVAASDLPLIVARPSVVVGHTRLGLKPSASIFWHYRVIDLLHRNVLPPDARDDAIPMDYAAEALCLLLFKPKLAHKVYHVSSGVDFSSTQAEIAAVFARHHGERPDTPMKVASVAEILTERDRLAPLLGPGNEERMLMALELYYGFGTLGIEVFDNARLLSEGMRPPPRLTDYLDLCITSDTRSVYEQMTDDD